MLSVKRILYSLKRRFGSDVDFYIEVDGEVDILTGKKTIKRTKCRIKNAIILDAKTATAGPLTKILSQLTGILDVNQTSILVDGCQFPSEFQPTFIDYVVIDNERFNIKDWFEIDDEQSFQFNLTEYKGEKIFKIHDINIHDKIHFIQIIQKLPKCVYRQKLEDQIIFTDLMTQI